MTSSAARTTRRLMALALAGSLTAAACGGGESALDAGEDDDTEATTAPAETSGDDTDATADSESSDSDAGDDQSAESTAGPTTTVAPLEDLPPCPVDALDAAGGPVEITFWHGMANELETALIDVVDGYNASQDRVQVVLQNQTAYESAIDKYIAGGTDSRPDIIQLPEYIVQSFAQSDTFVPMQACIDAAGFDMAPILPRVADTYMFEGIQWAMPFNVSSPVLYFNKQMYEAAGLDPDDPPISLEELRAVSQQLVDSGAAAHGIVLDSGRDSGGGWFFEQWFGRAGELFADNGNGRIAPATRVLFDNDTGFDILTYLQEMTASGLAVTVGDNAGGQDSFFKMIDAEAPGCLDHRHVGGDLQRRGRTRFRSGSWSHERRHRHRPDAGAERHARRAARWCVIVDPGRQERRGDRCGVGLHAVPDRRTGPVDVGGRNRLRPDPNRRRRARPDRCPLRGRSAIPSGLRPDVGGCRRPVGGRPGTRPAPRDPSPDRRRGRGGVRRR